MGNLDGAAEAPVGGVPAEVMLLFPPFLTTSVLLDCTFLVKFLLVIPMKLMLILQRQQKSRRNQ